MNVVESTRIGKDLQRPQHPLLANSEIRKKGACDPRSHSLSAEKVGGFTGVQSQSDPSRKHVRPRPISQAAHRTNSDNSRAKEKLRCGRCTCKIRWQIESGKATNDYRLSRVMTPTESAGARAASQGGAGRERKPLTVIRRGLYNTESLTYAYARAETTYRVKQPGLLDSGARAAAGKSLEAVPGLATCASGLRKPTAEKGSPESVCCASRMQNPSDRNTRILWGETSRIQRVRCVDL